MNAMPPVRVMLVDDSSTVRRLLEKALSQYPEIEVVGTAANGVIALQRLPQLNPEAVILDVEMPEMDGITTLKNVRAQYPRLPVIMFSTLTERGATTTFDALAVGASDYVLKPSTQLGETLETVVVNHLVPKLLALTRSRFGLALQAAMTLAAEVSEGKVPPPSGTGASTSALAQSKPSMAGGSSLTRQAGAFAPRGPRTFGPGTGRPFTPSTPSMPSTPSVTPSQVAPITGLTTTLPERPSTPITTTTKLVPPVGAPVDPAVRSALARGVAPAGRPPVVVAPSTGPRKPIQIIAIAASTGGPNALADILPKLPSNLPVPIVIVQHMPPIFTRCLADRLGGRSELRVIESAGGERLMPGHVYIAPGNRHLEVVREADGVRTQLSDGQPENSCRPAADVLLRSVARTYGGAAMCIVLTGMGHDGLRGAREVYDHGGRVLVQSGPTCVVWGMPKAVEEAGIAEAIVPLPEMSAAILQRVGIGRRPEEAR